MNVDKMTKEQVMEHIREPFPKNVTRYSRDKLNELRERTDNKRVLKELDKIGNRILRTPIDPGYRNYGTPPRRKTRFRLQIQGMNGLSTVGVRTLDNKHPTKKHTKGRCK